jgi:Catalytic LigB subunit of aromatic ring-opening dioxygenase
VARIVGGFATSHSPMLNSPPERWAETAKQELENPRGGGMPIPLDIPALIAERAGWIDKEITLDTWKVRSAACESAIATLGKAIGATGADVAVMIGDDTHEVFMPEEHIPAVDVYWGPEIVHIPHPSRSRNLSDAEKAPRMLSGAPDLGEHLIGSLVEQGFDVSHTRRIDERRHIGHAFDFVYARVLKNDVMPHVPILLNTYYKPNVPRLGRCYAMGKALRRAVESWERNSKVAIIGTGGMTHTLIDEDLDKRVLRMLHNRDEAALPDLPEDEFVFGTSEVRNWMVVAGAMHDSDSEMHLIDYVPCYRTPAGTGCAMGFAYWR